MPTADLADLFTIVRRYTPDKHVKLSIGKQVGIVSSRHNMGEDERKGVHLPNSVRYFRNGNIMSGSDNKHYMKRNPLCYFVKPSFNNNDRPGTQKLGQIGSKPGQIGSKPGQVRIS